MAKKTLLDMTQTILSDMNGDEVVGIGDTEESTQVAQIIKDSYEEIISSRTWPHLNQLIQLTPQGASRPTHMDTSPTWAFIELIKYNVRKQSATRDSNEDIFYMEPDDFLNLLNQRNSSSASVDTITDPSSIKLYITNDDRPRYWTTFDDEVMVFDSYDNLVDTNLQESKFQCWGNVEPLWVHTDLHVPDLPAKAFPYLLAESKSTCFNTILQVGNQKAEQQSRRQRVWLAREKWRANPNGGMGIPDYGRKGSNSHNRARRHTHLRKD